MRTRNRHLTPILLVAALAIPVAAQPPEEAPSLKGVVRLNKAPVSNELLRVKLPRPQEATLKNGMTLMVLEDHRVPTFTLRIVLPVSSLAEPEDLLGVAGATAAMLTLGTKTMDSRQLAEKLAELGGSLNASSGSSTTSISVSGLIDNMDDLLGMLREVLLEPTFPQDELDKWKQSQLARLQQLRSNPSFLASERISRILYPDDLRGVVVPTEESIRTLTRENLVDYHAARFVPMAGGLVGVAGDVSRQEMTEKIEKLLAGWKPGKAQPPEVKIEGPIQKRQIVLIDRPNSVQTHLVFANRAITRMDPDYVACMVMNHVLGSGPSARLFRNIREEKGYTYGIYSSFDASKYVNDFSASMSVRTEVTGPATEELLKEFRDIRDRLVPAEELASAKRALVASFALSLESTPGLLGRAMSLKEYGLPADYWNNYPDMVMKVTAEQVRQVARKYVPVDNIQIVAVGDPARIRDVLKQFGEVEEYTAEGARVD